MGWDFYFSIGALLLAISLGLILARHNLKILHETKDERMEERRKYKIKKNQALAKFYGIDWKPPKDRE